jgi:hypothetical protein
MMLGRLQVMMLAVLVLAETVGPHAQQRLLLAEQV